MKSLFVLLVLTACAIAHNGDYIPINYHELKARNGPRSLIKEKLEALMNDADPLAHTSTNYRLANYVMNGKDRLRTPFAPLRAEYPLLLEEIKRIERLPEKSEILYKSESEKLLQPARHPNVDHNYPEKPMPSVIFNIKGGNVQKPPTKYGRILKISEMTQPRSEEKHKEKNTFAFTPMDREYFLAVDTSYSYIPSIKKRTTKDDQDHRQNFILSHDKTSISGKLEDLKKQLAKHGMRLPLTLIPTSMNWLKISPEINRNDSDKSKTEAQDVFGMNGDTVYFVVLAAAIAAAIIVPTLVVGYGIYMLMKHAKAGAAVEYPAYGVTGPSVDSYGDRSLAQSAQMYHYHHQKQQIIALERNANEQRNSSMSEPESEENEEGEYTVYECPGFATTGEMEVKNPLFDEPTPATPGKMQVVQSQLKE